jgi:hypothetical protein
MVAMLAAALLAFCENIKIGIFSTSQRTSRNLLQGIRDFLLKIPGFNSKRIVVTNAEELRVAHVPGDQWRDGGSRLDQTNVCFSYSASAKTTRGFTVDCIILEEAAHMSEDLWLQVVVPALAVEHTVLLAITTPQDPTNYFSRLLTYKRGDGSPLFLVQALGLACKECLEKNMAAKCNHMSNVLPKWKGEGRHETQRAIYSQHNKNMFSQETQGLIVEDATCVFRQEDIKAFADARPHYFGSAPFIVYSFVDPSGGGTQSAYVVFSMVYDATADLFVVLSFSLSPPPFTDTERETESIGHVQIT